MLRGDHKGAYAIARELESHRSERFVPLSSLAAIYSGLGNKDRALDQLEKAVEEGEPPCFCWGEETLFDNLRSEPRFREISRRLNLNISRAPSP